MQTVTRLVARALAQAGETVSIVTRQPGSNERGNGYRLVRRPKLAQLLEEYHKADAILLQGLPLRLGWPLFVRGAPAMAVHHIHPARSEPRLSKFFRHQLARRVRHGAVSHALARELPWTSDTVLPNPYDEKVFRKDGTGVRRRDLVFVGRLVADKGVAILIEALALLLERGQLPTTTIVGEGPEQPRLEEMVQSRGLTASVTFTGEVTGHDLARILNRHLLLVVPSVWQEAFGLAVLEGIACGCAAVGSQTGGIPEAIGPCGTTFRMGDAAGLATTIRELLGHPEAIARFQSFAARHLERHKPAVVAGKYLEVLSNLRAGKMPRSLSRTYSEKRPSINVGER